MVGMYTIRVRGGGWNRELESCRRQEFFGTEARYRNGMNRIVNNYDCAGQTEWASAPPTGGGRMRSYRLNRRQYARRGCRVW